MNSYFVRHKQSKEAVGIFVANDLRLLCQFIDQVCEPADCEFLRLREGGLVWDDNRNAPNPQDLIEFDDDTKEPKATFDARVSFDENWMGRMINGEWLDLDQIRFKNEK